MEEELEKKRIFGLVGRNISYSFSRSFFLEKFKKESIPNTDYQLFDLEDIQELKNLFQMPYLKGLNVTIPYKEKACTIVDELSKEAKEIGAINTLKIENGKSIGYNTDILGFELSFKKHLRPFHKKALVLGTGGAAKAVCFVLKKLSIEYLLVSREKKRDAICYEQLSPEILNEYLIVINTTPLGTHPKTEEFPPMPYFALSKKHYLYDLTYNPTKSAFLKKGKEKESIIKNGLEMLHTQAEHAWKIWIS